MLRRTSKSRHKRQRRFRSCNLTSECLEVRLPLDASGFDGNDCAPDLDLSGVATQAAFVNEEVIIDLAATGGTVTDLDDSGNATGDSIFWQLDPDDQPAEAAGATMDANGVFSWTPTTTGTFEFIVISVDDGTPALADAETFSVTVTERTQTENTTPDLTDIPEQQASVGTELIVDLSATDADGDTLTFQIDPDELQTLGATLEQDGGNTATLKWTPTSSDAGETIELTVLITDDGSPPKSDSEKIVIQVSGVMANDDTYDATTTDGVIAVDAASGVLANDTSVGDATLTASVVDDPQNGTVTVDSDGAFTYTANSTFRGTDTFTYQAMNPDGDTSTATVSIVVNAKPVAADDSYTVDEDIVLNILEDVGVLANDSDGDGDSITATIVDNPTNGTVALSDDGAFVYTPAANFNGTDSFTYIVDDGALPSEAATVTITVNPINDAPVVVDDTYTATEETLLGVAIAEGLLVNDTDIDGDSLTVSLVDDVDNGALVFGVEGSFSYTPNVDFNGVDTFTYTVSDGDLVSNEGTVTINVGATNDRPVANPDTYSINEGTELVVDIANGVLANDTDADGDTLTAKDGAQTFNGTLTLNADGSFTYTPNANFTGEDQFTYFANDGTEDSVVVGLVSITVNDINQAPVGVTDTYDATEDVTLSIDTAAGLLSNDTDADGDTLTATDVTQPTEGQVTVNPNGSFEYSASQNSSGTAQFTYRVTDGEITSDPITVQINVTTSNDAPVGVTDTYNVDHNTQLSINSPGVLDNDQDSEGDALTATLVIDVSNGTLDLRSDGSFDYTPNTDFSGTDSFTYDVSDGQAQDNVTVNLTVADANSFTVSAAAAEDTIIGTVSSASSSSPVFYQFEDDTVRSELVLRPDDHLSGAVDAPVVLVEYLDFQCPSCASWHPIIEDFKTEFAGDLVVVSRHLPLQSNSRAAARVAEAAGQQGKFDEMADLLFENQTDWAGQTDPSSFFSTYAATLGLNITQYTTDLLDPDLDDRITEDANDAFDLGAQGTPTFFLNGERAAQTNGPGLQALINTAIADAGSYKIDRETGVIRIADNSDIATESLKVIATQADGSTETIDVTINAQEASASGVLAYLAVDQAVGEDDDEDWLAS